MRCVAFLRAVNVGGRTVKMAALAQHFEALGHREVETFIASGNVIFRTQSRTTAALAAKIADGLEPLLGFRAEAFVRTEPEVQTLAARAAATQAVHRAAVGPQGEVNVALTTLPLTAAQATALAGLRTPLDRFEHNGTEVYWLCGSKQSDSSFSNAVFERRLGIRTTIRRASMLERLAAHLRGEPAGR